MKGKRHNEGKPMARFELRMTKQQAEIIKLLAVNPSWTIQDTILQLIAERAEQSGYFFVGV